jgi:hypothetical protein
MSFVKLNDQDKILKRLKELGIKIRTDTQQ